MNLQGESRLWQRSSSRERKLPPERVLLGAGVAFNTVVGGFSFLTFPARRVTLTAHSAGTTHRHPLRPQATTDFLDQAKGDQAKADADFARAKALEAKEQASRAPSISLATIR